MRNFLDDKNWLYDAYVTKGLSTTQIGKIVGRSSKLVSLRLKKYNIPSRNISAAMKTISKQISKNNLNNWEKQDYRKQITESVHKAYKNEQLRLTTRNGSVNYWENNEYAKSKASAISKKMWTNKDYKNKVIDGLNKVKPNMIEKCRKASLEMWKDTELKQRAVAVLKIACNTEKWKEDASARSMMLWQNKEYKEKVRASLKLVQSTPEYKRNLALGRLKQKSTSYEERIVSAILNEYNLPNKKVVIGPHEFDLQVDIKTPLLIEVQGERYHPKNRPNDKSKLTYYKRYLSKQFNFIYIHDYDFCSNGLVLSKLNKALKIVIRSQQISLKQIEFKEVNRTDHVDFYSKFHYIGNQGKYGYSIGGYYNSKLICCVTYSGCTRKEIIDRLSVKSTEIRELSRLCRHPLYECRNMLSKLISESIKMIRKNRSDWKYLVTYADQTIGHSGAVYKASNWKYDGSTPPSYHYIRDNHITHKKTVWDRSKKMSMGEDDYAKEHDFIKVPELSKLRFL